MHRKRHVLREAWQKEVRIVQNRMRVHDISVMYETVREFAYTPE